MGRNMEKYFKSLEASRGECPPVCPGNCNTRNNGGKCQDCYSFVNDNRDLKLCEGKYQCCKVSDLNEHEKEILYEKERQDTMEEEIREIRNGVKEIQKIAKSFLPSKKRNSILKIIERMNI